jgi:hypothetical protein
MIKVELLCAAAISTPPFLGSVEEQNVARRAFSAILLKSRSVLGFRGLALGSGLFWVSFAPRFVTLAQLHGMIFLPFTCSRDALKHFVLKPYKTIPGRDEEGTRFNPTRPIASWVRCLPFNSLPFTLRLRMAVQALPVSNVAFRYMAAFARLAGEVARKASSAGFLTRNELHMPYLASTGSASQ